MRAHQARLRPVLSTLEVLLEEVLDDLFVLDMLDGHILYIYIYCIIIFIHCLYCRRHPSPNFGARFVQATAVPLSRRSPKSPADSHGGPEPHTTLGLQIAQSRYYLPTLNPKP